MMEGIMEQQCELPAFDFHGMEDGDLGLTLSPGSQSQPSGPWLEGPDIDLHDLGLDLDFDPFTNFHQVVHQLADSNKRTRDKAFADEVDQLAVAGPVTKRPSIGGQIPLPVIEKPLGMTPEHQASIASHVPPDTPAALSASAAVVNRFPIGEAEFAHHVAVEATVRGHRDSDHVSPYGPVGYHPSAPELHSRMVGVTNQTLQNRLVNSRRRVDVLTAERNKYRDGLLKYTSFDPKTGKLGIHAMEAELATLRRVCSTQQQRAKQYKADVQEWRSKYVDVAQSHNSLLRDYQQLQQSVSQSTNPPPNEANASHDYWKGKYQQLSQAFNELSTAFIHSSPPSPRTTISPPSPASLPTPSLTHPSTSLSTTLPSGSHLASCAPTPASLSANPSPVVCVATNPAPSGPIPTPPSTRPPSNHLSAAGSTLTDNMAATAARNVPLASLTLEEKWGFLAHLMGKTAGNMAQPATMAAAATNVSLPTEAPKESPKDIQVIDVIDLTMDSTVDPVSAPGININTAPPAANTQLTNFHNQFRKKEMTWLRNQGTDSEATQKLFQQLIDQRKKSGAIKYGIGRCYEHVQTQKGIRRSLGGPFAPISPVYATSGEANRPTDAVIVRMMEKQLPKEKRAAKNDSYNPTDEDLVRMMEEEFANDSSSPGTVAEEPYNPTDDELARIMEEELAKDDSSMIDQEPYNPSDDELARMMEEELAKDDSSTPSEEPYNPTDDDLARMMEEELANA
ncbi:uncharacterized protein N7459_003594 [Penicillium hispanicum]|uniref:uncharacterized protein n=1 Tax=Penicillium hispanicum TaxID=1080232 RepID=UPI002541BE5D|nr:uncharacterized protein N7459_003594 [Penicillium hispanicum]KAJ5587829.1 hypothetical protein N7459_003594 [Penicillium hispanicum]